MSGIMNMFVAAKTTVATAVDAFFNSVSLLLNTSSTNGAQNNTFLDSSTNNFTITRNGNTTQGTFTPFSQTGWSNYFDGTDDDFSITSDVKLTPAAGDFTLECWIYPTSWGGSGTFRAITAGPVSGCMFFGQTSTNFGLRSLAVADVVVTSTLPTVNTWTHVAVSRSGTTARLFINGALAATATDSTNFPQTQFVIGNTSVGGSEEYSGYISNLRFVKGTAVYTSAFTPSTTPLTAVTNTQLLTCQSNRFVDNSANAFALSIGGTPSVQAFSPFAPTAAYDAAVVGGSGYFDGTGDSLSATGSSLNPNGTDYTIEFWAYSTSTASQTIFVSGTSGNGRLEIYIDNATLYFGLVGTGVTGVTIPKNSWAYIACVKSGTTHYVYVDGVRNTAGTGLSANSQTLVTIGSSYVGYFSGFRISNTAVYTGTTMTVPTSPNTTAANTQLLVSATNAGIFDSAAKNVLETVGNAQVSTTQAKWGTTSMYFDGTGDNLILPNSPIYDFGTGNFTIEGWVYIVALSGSVQGTFIGRGVNGGASFHIAVSTGGTWLYYLSSNNSSWNIASAVSMGSATVGSWQHIALVRNGTTFTPYLNGVAGTTTTSSSSIYWNSSSSSANQISIGGSEAATQVLNGYIDDLRISKYARYTASFTPPTAALPTQ